MIIDSHVHVVGNPDSKAIDYFKSKRDARLTDDQREKVVGETAAALYGL